MTAPIALRLHAATKSFGGRTILKGLSLDLGAGRVLAIVGESGCGKSTLLRLLAGLERPDSGACVVEGRVSVAFQDARLLPWLRVGENVAFGVAGTKLEVGRRVSSALDAVGLAARAEAWPGTLSGGEAQRVALARSLVRNPDILLLDEPFGALDALTRLRMHALLLRLWEQHRFTVVLVTHDVDEALSLGDRVIVLGSGRILDDVELDLARPRDRQDAGFGLLRHRLLERLGVPAS